MDMEKVLGLQTQRQLQLGGNLQTGKEKDHHRLLAIRK
jgi:hypothetical protein